MKPEVEHAARMLADIVRADRVEPYGRMNDAGFGEVSIELRGMVHHIRQHIMLDYAALATKVVNEIEKQVAAVDLDAEIARLVRAEVDSIRHRLGHMVRERIDKHVTAVIDSRVGNFAKRIARKVSDRMLKLAVKEGAW